VDPPVRYAHIDRSFWQVSFHLFPNFRYRFANAHRVLGALNENRNANIQAPLITLIYWRINSLSCRTFDYYELVTSSR
jgi:hypothetical protein